MGKIRFLSVEQVLTIHRTMIERYGGDPSIRDLGLIESAVLLPQQSIGGRYLHPTIADMAAAYLFHLCSNHGFVDGNKRTAAGAALVFRDANGRKAAFTIEDLERITVGLAGGVLDKAQVTKLFRAAIPSTRWESSSGRRSPGSRPRSGGAAPRSARARCIRRP
jgi:death-on-curing protein